MLRVSIFIIGGKYRDYIKVFFFYHSVDSDSSIAITTIIIDKFIKRNGTPFHNPHP